MLGISVHTVRTHLKILRLGMSLVDDSQICYALAAELRALQDDAEPVSIFSRTGTV